MQEENKKAQANVMPVLPLRDVVIYPNMVIPLYVGREKSVKAVDAAAKSGRQVLLVTQKDPRTDDPAIKEIYSVGTIANTLQVLRLPDNTVKVLTEGVKRGKAVRYFEEDGILWAEIVVIAEGTLQTQEFDVLVRAVFSQFEIYVRLNPKIPPEIVAALANIDDPGRLADHVAAHMPLKVGEKQQILEASNIKQRLELILGFLQFEIEMLEVENRLKERVKKQVDKNQREFYLHEKLKAIQKELGELDERGQVFGELEKIKIRIEKVGLSKEAKDKALTELSKLKMMPPMSAEATVSRSYLEWLLDLPWKEKSSVNKDLNKASKILEEDHYGLEKVKERIIEYLAVEHRAEKVKGPILCLVGPPGVGKTSLGQSIARATGRKFLRVALGGVRDEAEIRGHRRTYIGSMPGKILQKMAKGKVRNPLFMLDEVDKMAMDFRGDPAAALLEVLDPEQNNAFNDHYLEVDYDLSDVMFITTANSLDIPPPLLDRMEVIRLPGYTEEEKLHIATRYLIPKQVKETGLKKTEISFTDEALRAMIRDYTREAGVRNLERAIAKICRKVLKGVVLKELKKREVIVPRNLEKYLGVRIYHFSSLDKCNRVGEVTGLAWTESGGELLSIEVAVVPGTGKNAYTGQLGEVMQESMQAALTVVRSRVAQLGIKENFYEKNDVHVHAPEGATPKDGPSAGISVCTALVSALTMIPVRADVAMTGEITLRGEILPIGGLKEKLLAATRGDIKIVLIPEENRKDLKEIPKEVLSKLDVRPVRWIDQVLDIALERKPKPLLAKAIDKKAKTKVHKRKA
ncbi:MAG: endopeptidase La [Gammaproteobacteria bacterium]